MGFERVQALVSTLRGFDSDEDEKKAFCAVSRIFSFVSHHRLLLIGRLVYCVGSEMMKLLSRAP